MDRKVIITNAVGQQMQADVITAFNLKNNNSKYIVYTFNEKTDNNIKTYISRIREESGEIYFDAIQDENEWKMVKQAIINQAKN